jgi:hypothetical protein
MRGNEIDQVQIVQLLNAAIMSNIRTWEMAIFAALDNKGRHCCTLKIYEIRKLIKYVTYKKPRCQCHRGKEKIFH